MKAIVAEIDRKQMIVITDKGDFIKVRRQMSVGIGDEIELKQQNKYLTYGRLARIAACFIACILLSTGVYAYYTPYSYVSVDINPSIALSLNRFERVIAVDPLNEDAADLIKDTGNLKNQDIYDALSDIIKSASEKGYIDEAAENQVMVVVSAKNPSQEKKLESRVTETAAKELSKVNDNYGVIVEKTSVASYKDAIGKKVSPGKEILAEKVREVIPEIKNEEVRNMSVKEAMHLIKEGRKALKAAEKDDKNKDKDSNKENDKDQKEQAVNNDDNEKKNEKEASKAAKEIKEGKKKDEKEKPAAAASKKSDEADDEKIKPAEEDKDKNNKDSEEEQKKKDKPDRDKEDIKEKDGKNSSAGSDSEDSDSGSKEKKDGADEKSKGNDSKGKSKDGSNGKTNE